MDDHFELDPAVCDWMPNDRSGAARALGRTGREGRPGARCLQLWYPRRAGLKIGLQAHSERVT